MGQQQRQLQGRSGGRWVTTAMLHQWLVQALLGKHWANPSPAPPLGPWAGAPPWSAPKVCPTLLQKDKPGWRGWGLGTKLQHFLGGLALAHTGCKVTISEKADIRLTKVALPIDARAQLIDRCHFRKPGEKLLFQLLVGLDLVGVFC